MRCRQIAAASLIISAINCTQSGRVQAPAPSAKSVAAPAPAAVAFVGVARPQPNSDILSPQEYRVFMGTVSTELRARDIMATFGTDWVQISGGRLKTSTLGLRNLMQTCKASPQEEWANLISEHFENILETMRQQATVSQEMREFEQAKKHLVVRLYSAGAVPADARRQLVTRVDMPGTLTVLMLDLPKAVQSVSADMARAWRKDDRELFAIALENVRRLPAPDERQMQTANGNTIFVIEGADLVTSSHALLLKDHPHALGRYGAIVSVPTRNRVMCLPIENASIAKAAAEMAPLVRQAREAGPGGTSDKLYWYHDGRFSEVPTTVQGGEAVVRIPDELMEQLGARGVKTASGREPGE